MRKIVVAVMSTISSLVLLFSYHTSTNAAPPQTGTADPTTDSGAAGGVTPHAQSAPVPGGSGGPSGSGGTDTGSADSGASSGSGSSSDSGSSSGSGSTSGTFTGDLAQTRWGPVQVQIVVEGGKITSASAVEYPTENPKDRQINSYAIPTLNAEAVSAQSADIDAVSGATVTSGGYITSLQSAVDQAHLT